MRSNCLITPFLDVKIKIDRGHALLSGDTRCWYLLFFVLVIVLSARAIAQERGQWLIAVPEVGDLTLELSGPYMGQNGGKLLWLFEDRQVTWTEEDGSVRLYLNSGMKEEKPKMLFQLRRDTDGSLSFQEGGLVNSERLKWWARMQWLPVDRKDEKRSNAFNYARFQRERFTERGYLKRFPPTFPVAFVETTALLFIDRTHELSPLLEFADLSPQVIETIGRYALAQPENTGFGFVLPRIAAHPHCPPDLLTELFTKSDDPFTWRAAALNSTAPAAFRETYLQRIKSGTERTRALVARDTLAPRDAWELAIAQKEGMVLNEFARNKAAPPELLAMIASQRGGQSDVELAGNSQTPPDILESLAKKTDKQVLWALMRNASASKAQVAQALRTLATSKSQNERSTAALDARLPLDLFPKLAADKSIHIRMCVANNLGTPVEILEQLAFDPYQTVSDHARYLLKEYHPAKLATIQDRLPDLKSLNPANGLADEFQKAVEAGDMKTVRACLDQQDDPEERIGTGMLIGSVLKTHFAEFQQLLSTEIRKTGVSAKQELAMSEALRPEHLSWMKTEGFLKPPWSAMAMQKAFERGDAALVKGLLDAGTPIDPADLAHLRR